MRPYLLTLTAALLLSAPAAAAEKLSITKEGQHYRAFLDRLDVENHWLPGQHITDWLSGKSDGKKGATHCSLFVAAACHKWGAPMLLPPPQKLLANRQQAWLRKEGRAKGWRRVRPLEAQRLANAGTVVVASYRNPNAKKPGHIAMVRPAAITPAQVAVRGPRVTSAGGHNYNDVDVRKAFRQHPKAWENDEVLFFAYLGR